MEYLHGSGTAVMIGEGQAGVWYYSRGKTATVDFASEKNSVDMVLKLLALSREQF